MTALVFPGASAYLAALGLTIAIESPVYGLLLRAIAGTPVRRGIVVGIAVNLISHPVAFLVLFPLLSPRLGGLAALALVEVAAVSVESMLLWMRRRRDPLALLGISYLANAASLSLGLLLLR